MQYKNPGVLKFKAVIEGDNEGTFVYFPYLVEEVFGVKGRIPVNATFDGIAYQGSLVRYSSPKHMILVLKSIRKSLNKTIGDSLDVTIELDTKERTIDAPKDLEDALKNKEEAKAYFESLAFSHKREYVKYLDDAKKLETRARRLERVVEMLENKLKF